MKGARLERERGHRDRVLEEAVELVEIAVRDGQELGGVGGAGIGAPDRAELDLELVAEALDAPRRPDQVTALELAGEEVGVAEGACGDRARPVAKLDGEVGSAAPCGEAVLARAGEHPLDLVAGAQLGDLSPLPCESGHALNRDRELGQKRRPQLAPRRVGYGECDERCDLVRSTEAAAAGAGLRLQGLERRRRGSVRRRVFYPGLV